MRAACRREALSSTSFARRNSSHISAGHREEIRKYITRARVVTHLRVRNRNRARTGFLLHHRAQGSFPSSRVMFIARRSSWCVYSNLFAPSSAAARSSKRSSGSSNPTERRKRSSGVGDPSPSSVHLCSARLSTPPNDVAGHHTRTRLSARSAASFPPAHRIESIPPNIGESEPELAFEPSTPDSILRRRLAACASATACPGCEGSPGYNTSRTMSFLSSNLLASVSAVRHLPRHANRERSHSPTEEPRLEGTQHRAAHRARASHRVPSFVVRRGDDRAGDDVGVAVEVFCGGVHDEIRAEVDGAETEGGEDGGVDAQRRVLGFGDGGGVAEIGDFPRRIGGGLDPYEGALAVVARCSRQVAGHGAQS